MKHLSMLYGTRFDINENLLLNIELLAIELRKIINSRYQAYQEWDNPSTHVLPQGEMWLRNKVMYRTLSLR